MTRLSRCSKEQDKSHNAVAGLILLGEGGHITCAEGARAVRGHAPLEDFPNLGSLK